ncbi:MAG: hypothetical protein SPG61_03730 [Arcanobacterium sp.]|nr:hypothetical protein [Arcanobacterium sp.]
MAYKFSVRQATPADFVVYSSLLPEDLYVDGFSFLARELTASAHATYWVAQKGTQLLAVARTSAPVFTAEKILLVLDGIYLADSNLIAAQNIQVDELLDGFFGRLIGDLRMAALVDQEQEHALQISAALERLGFSRFEFPADVLSKLQGPGSDKQTEFNFIYLPEE